MVEWTEVEMEDEEPETYEEKRLKVSLLILLPFCSPFVVFVGTKRNFWFEKTKDLIFYT